MVHRPRMRKSTQTPRRDRLARGGALVATSVALIALAFLLPGHFSSLIIGVALVPMLFLAERTAPFAAAVAGATAGAAVMALVCGWLWTFHPGALIIAMVLGAFWFAVAIAFISAGLRTQSRLAFPAAAFVWASCEIARAQGFPAFPYATFPYALADSAAALSLASIGGAPLVGLAIAGANVSFFAAARRFRDPRPGRKTATALRAAFGAACVMAVLASGSPDVPAKGPDGGTLIATETPTGQPAAGSYRVVLVQPSLDDQKKLSDYTSAFKTLSELSDGALRYNPDLVVWHETAVIPPIEWHLRHRTDRPTYEFVNDAYDYLSGFSAALLAGNGWADPDDVRRTIEHNSALLFSGGAIAGRYDKVKLVPFSEYLPPELRTPALSRWLISRFGTFWTPGSGPASMVAGTARFAAPICFEDSFGRYFASFDAPDFFVVLTNDGWARSAAMQKQHLAMSRYRAAETGSVVLRAANTGTTAAIAGNGAVAGTLAPFRKGALVVDVPLGIATTTPYEAAGKHADIAIFCIGLTLMALIAATRAGAFRIDKNDGV